jgi:tRNA threonylcarbamoyladenosine biosynthesis protein TsaB
MRPGGVIARGAEKCEYNRRMLGMVILALDTTTRAGSVAVLRDGVLRAQVVGDAQRTHGERLPGDIEAALAQAATPIGAVDLYAVAAGPGSFTGVRVGIAAIQGLALAQAKKVVPVPALEALAYLDGIPTDLVCAWIDAQRGQVFAALYERRAGGLHRLLGPEALVPADVLSRWQADLQGSPVTFVGDGALRYEALIRAAAPRATVLAPLPPLAPTIATIAARRTDAAVSPHAIVPIYVRAPDAEIARDRRRQAGEAAHDAGRPDR